MEELQKNDPARFVRELVNLLDAQSDEITLECLPAVADLAEKQTKGKIADALRQICFPTATSVGNGLVSDGCTFYEVEVGVDPHERTQLGLSILERTAASQVKAPKPRTIGTPSSLIFQTAKIWLPENLLLHADDVAASTRAIIQGASVWYEGKLAFATKAAKDNLVNQLYLYIQAQLPRNFPASHFWFTTITEDRARYIIDPSLIEPTLRCTTEAAINLGMGPAELVVKFLSTAIPANESFTLVALQSGHCIEINMREAVYQNKLPETFLSELAVFGCEVMCMYPICCDGDTHLVSVFSADLKDQLLPKLEASRAALTQKFKLVRSQLSPWRNLVGHSLVARDGAVTLGAVAGAFTGEFVKHVTPR